MHGDISSIGGALQATRQRERLSVAELASLSGVSQATIRRIERSQKGNEVHPNTSTLKRLEDALNIQRGALDRLNSVSDIYLKEDPIESLSELHGVLEKVIGRLLSTASKDDTKWFVKDVANDTLPLLTDIYMTLKIEGMKSGSSWVPDAAPLEHVILEGMTAPEPERGTPAHRRWSYRRWLLSGNCEKVYAEEFQKRLRAVSCFEKGINSEGSC